MRSARPVILLVTLATTAFTIGCQTTTVTPAPSSASISNSDPTSAKLERGKRIYVVTPKDGSYGKEQYSGSGQTVVDAFNGILSRYADDVVVGETAESNLAAIEAAKGKGCDYAVIPKIIHWEDRATEWSGIRDKMELFVKVVRVNDGSEVVSAGISGKSAWMTFGGDHPQDLVKRPVEEFVTNLFR